MARRSTRRRSPKFSTSNPNGHLYYFDYPVVDEAGEETGEKLTVATTRPETMLGDTAVAVHPDDERYRHLIGQQVRLPLVGRLIAIVADEYSDPEKGTGAVKITPAHDFNDFEVGKRHEAEGARPINILDAEARIQLKGNLAFFEGVRRGSRRTRGSVAAVDGLDRFEARKRIVAMMALAGPAREDRAPRAHGSARRPLERGDRAVADRPMVCRRQDAGAAGARGGARRAEPRSCRRTGRRPISTGWRTSSRGASRASSGGAIRFRRGTSPWGDVLCRGRRRRRGLAPRRSPTASSAAP